MVGTRCAKPAKINVSMPAHQLGIDAFHAVTALACALRIPDLAARRSTQDRGGDWQLPHYRGSQLTGS